MRLRNPFRPRTELQVWSGPVPEEKSDLEISHRAVTVYKPVVLMDAAGTTQAGMDKQLVADWLAYQVEKTAGLELGPVSADFIGHKGRFAAVNLHLEAWSSDFAFMFPVGRISGKLKTEVLDPYRVGISRKAAEEHKGHQDYREANRTIQQALNNLERLRDDGLPHFNDPEFAFMASWLRRGITTAPLIPVPVGGRENVKAKASRSTVAPGTLPDGG